MASASERSDYDLIVVGSGAGGATVARQMAVNGHRVLVLERGGRASMLGAAPTVALALEKMGLPNVWTIVALAHLLGHAAADTDHSIRLLFLPLHPAPQFGEHFFLRFFTHRTGVHQHHIGLFRLGHQLQTMGLFQ